MTAFDDDPDPPPPDPSAPGSAIGARVDLGEPASESEPDPTPRPRGDPGRLRTPGSPASFWRRLGAYLIDAIVIFIATTVAVELVLGGQPPTDVDPLAPDALDVLWPYYAVNGAIAWSYFALMESSSRQATIGKHLLGLEVTDEHGDRISFLRATGRYFGKLASAIPLGLGFLMIFTSERNQALHDHLANCLVLEQEPDPQPAAGPNVEDPTRDWEP